MKKAIHIDNNSNAIVRVLSITDESAVENSPNGLNYILIENYTAPPETEELQKAYPMYNKETGVFYWVTVDYQLTPDASLLDIENLKQELMNEREERQKLQEVTDALLLESLGGAANV